MRLLRRQAEVSKTVIAVSKAEFVGTVRACPRNFSEIFRRCHELDLHGRKQL